MSARYRFVKVHHQGFDRTYDFTLNSTDIRLLECNSQALKEIMIDLAIGEERGESGSVEIATELTHLPNQIDILPITDHWQAATILNQHLAWVAGNGGLISNLKVWENITLPLWYRAERDLLMTEQRVLHWLKLLGLEPDCHANFMASPPYTLEPWQRKLAGMLRAFVSNPSVLVVDANVFDNIKSSYLSCWFAALEAFATQGHAVLVIADRATTLPWVRIE
jgi:phospholipid/cholesterol/gamma-HCH transport system ATP-binding protein